MSSNRTFVSFLKKIHVLIVRWYMDTGNFFSLVKAKITRRKIVYVQFARINNFGDMFNYDLSDFFDTQLIYTHSYKKSQMALCGSILGTYLRDYSGYILGAGFLASRYDRKGNNWNVKIIRGPLSASQCNTQNDNVLYADPGILASLIYAKPTKKIYELGIIPHSKDVAQMEKISWGAGIKFIHPRRKPCQVAYDIKQCKNIASSSLHGLIFADAFRIPNIHLKISNRLKGGLHKFNDYYYGMNMTYENIHWNAQLTDKEIINQCKLRCSDAYVVEKQKLVEEVMRTVFNEVRK